MWNLLKVSSQLQYRRALVADTKTSIDSSMRAVYAADNMVHAYDLDMEVPSLPVITDNLQHGEDTWSASMQRNPSAPNGAPSYIREARTNNETSLPAPSTRKRRKVKNRTRSSSSPPQGRMPLESTFSRLSSIVPNSGIVSPSATSPAPPGTVALIFDASGQVLLNCRPVRLREFLHEVIHECLRIGGRPEAMNAVESELGEVVMITMKGNGGQSHTTKIELSVDYEVPNFIIGMALPPSVVHLNYLLVVGGLWE